MYTSLMICALVELKKCLAICAKSFVSIKFGKSNIAIISIFKFGLLTRSVYKADVTPTPIDVAPLKVD